MIAETVAQRSGPIFAKRALQMFAVDTGMPGKKRLLVVNCSGTQVNMNY